MGSFLLFLSLKTHYFMIFSKMLYKYSYSKTFYNTFPIKSGFVCCKLQYQRALQAEIRRAIKKI